MTQILTDVELAHRLDRMAELCSRALGREPEWIALAEEQVKIALAMRDPRLTVGSAADAVPLAGDPDEEGVTEGERRRRLWLLIELERVKSLGTVGLVRMTTAGMPEREVLLVDLIELTRDAVEHRDVERMRQAAADWRKRPSSRKGGPQALRYLAGARESDPVKDVERLRALRTAVWDLEAKHRWLGEAFRSGTERYQQWRDRATRDEGDPTDLAALATRPLHPDLMELEDLAALDADQRHDAVLYHLAGLADAGALSPIVPRPSPTGDPMIDAPAYAEWLARLPVDEAKQLDPARLAPELAEEMLRHLERWIRETNAEINGEIKGGHREITGEITGGITGAATPKANGGGSFQPSQSGAPAAGTVADGDRLSFQTATHAEVLDVIADEADLLLRLIPDACQRYATAVETRQMGRDAKRRAEEQPDDRSSANLGPFLEDEGSREVKVWGTELEGMRDRAMELRRRAEAQHRQGFAPDVRRMQAWGWPQYAPPTGNILDWLGAVHDAALREAGEKRRRGVGGGRSLQVAAGTESPPAVCAPAGFDEGGTAANQHPALRLFHALNALHTVCSNAHTFSDLDQRRSEARALQIRMLNVSGAASAFGGPFDPPPSNEPDELADTLRTKVLEPGRLWCERARAALRAGGAKGLDAATHPNAAGQARSIEMHTKLQDAERVFDGLTIGVGNPRIIIDEVAARMADLGAWFARTRDELGAVFETRGLDVPAQTPAISVSPDVLARLEAAAGVIELLKRDDDGSPARNETATEGEPVPPSLDSPTSKPKPSRRERQMKWLAEAMLLVRDHPEWPDAAIAERVRIDKSRLSRSPEYQAAARMARSPKMPAGSVTVADGDRELEAVDDSFDPNRAASRQWQDEEDADDRIDREMRETQRKTQRGRSNRP